MNLIFLGDVVGKGGRNAVRRHLPELRRIYNAQFAIVNGENSAAGNGLTGSCVKELLDAADVITCGDHVWDQKGFENEIHLYPQVVRPANLSDLQPGKGYGIYRNPAGGEIAVISLMGKVFMRDSAYCPFETVNRILHEIPASVKNIFVDFHAEATSEKKTLGWALDGKVSAVLGTHTHVQTADAQIMPHGTAYLTDLGMCGVEFSSLGMDFEVVFNRFLSKMPTAFKPAKGDISLNGAYLDINDITGKAREIRIIREHCPAHKIDDAGSQQQDTAPQDLSF